MRFTHIDLLQKYVEGHKGIIGNEKADLLAKEGAKKCIIGKFI